MWKACVWTSMSFGICALGITPASVARLRGVTARHCRAIAQSPRHLTGETNDSLLSGLELKDPMFMLSEQCQAFVDRLEDVSLQACNAVLRSGSCIAQAKRALDQINTQKHLDQRSHVRLVQVPAAEGLPCDVCGLYFLNERALRTHMGHQHPEVNLVAKELMKDLPRSDLGVNGMPTCRRCGIKFHGWQNLLRHIDRGRFKGPVTVPDVEADETTKPLVERPRIVRELLRTNLACVREIAGLVDSLARHCCICFQWVGDTRHVKMHIMKTHAAIWSKHSAAVAEAAAKWGKGALGIGNPCQFCGLSYNSSHRGRHAKGCTIIFQCLLACQIFLESEAAHGRSGDSVLPTPSSQLPRAKGSGGGTGRSPTQRSRNRADRGCGDGPSQPRQVQGQLQARYRIRGKTPPGAVKYPGSRDDSHCGGSCFEVRGRALSHPPGQRIHHVPADEIPGHLGHDVSAQSGMEAAPERREGHIVAQTHPPEVLLYRAGQSPGPGFRKARNQGAEQQDAMDHTGRRRVTSVELPEVRPGQEGGSSGHGQATSGTQPGKGWSATGAEAREREHDPQVSCDSSLVQQLRGFDSEFSAPGLPERRGGSSSVQCNAVVGSLLGDAPHGLAHAQRADPALACRQQAVQDARERVRALALINPANLCYQHSFLLSIMWTFTFMPGMAERTADMFGGAITGSLVTVLRRLIQVAGRFWLHQILEWGIFLQDWRQPHRQHDVSSSLPTYCKGQPPAVQGTWQSRDGGGVIHDVGDLSQPIGLVLRDGRHDFQSCVTGWHRQDRTFALQRPADMLCFQIGRFRMGRRVTKIRSSLQPSHILVPVFRGAGDDVEHVLYRLTAIIVHLGSSPNGGHYRAVLMPGESHSEIGCEARNLTDEDLCHANITDDGVVPSFVQSSDLNMIHKDSYVCWFVKA